jgi:hypothetical protein
MNHHRWGFSATLLLSSIACLFHMTSRAQITATQGVSTRFDTTPLSDTLFRTAMVLTGPFPLADRTLWGRSQWTDPDIFQQFADYRCDGIAITGMQMRGTLLENGRLQVQVKGEFDSVASHDKKAHMYFVLLNDGEVIAVEISQLLPAPAGTTKAFQVDFELPTDRIRDEPPTYLRISFFDHDDRIRLPTIDHTGITL